MNLRHMFVGAARHPEAGSPGRDLSRHVTVVKRTLQQPAATKPKSATNARRA
jgi:hypothetical protein